MLIELAKKHPAFKTASKLESLASSYNVKILFLPKYHCEMNPIESVWCYSKNYWRKRNDQTFEKTLDLILESREEFKKSGINIKLWRRFWGIISAYNNKKSYKDVLNEFFGKKSKSNINEHRRILN